MKTLIAGAVPPGGLASLHARVARLHGGPHGPFDVLLVADLADGGGLAAYGGGAAAFPLPAYFASSSSDHADACAAFAAGGARSAASNLTFLGACGVARLPGGLHVAFGGSGADADATATAAALEQLRALARERPAAREAVVDVLLTPEWPAAGAGGGATAEIGRAHV